MDDSSDQTTPDYVDGAHACAEILGSPREVVLRYSHCSVCGGRLHFSHTIDFAKNLTIETARCPECGVQAKSFVHRLQ